MERKFACNDLAAYGDFIEWVANISTSEEDANANPKADQATLDWIIRKARGLCSPHAAGEARLVAEMAVGDERAVAGTA